ncbi:MAG: FecR domain-containing protein, partial [Burkholderiales bacterium]
MAFAGAVVESLRGGAQAGEAPLARGQRIAAPVAISTEAGAQVFLRFDDGMQIVLDGNSLLRVVDFRYAKGAPEGRAVFELLRGAARVVTGAVARDNPKQFFFRTPQTQLTVERPADFTVALVNPAYVTVNAGTVLSSNGWGTVPLSAGSTSAIATNAAAPASIPAASLPPSASSAIGNLSAASVGPPLG